MYFATLIFIFGTVIGSFLNVVIFRYGNNLKLKSLVGRSSCMSCKKNLSWYELIPVLSFLFQKGKCCSCKSKISWQYAIVELLTGLIFLATFYVVNGKSLSLIQNLQSFQIASLLYLLTIFSILIVITVYDIKHKIIPDGLSFLFAGLAFVTVLINSMISFNWIDLLAGPILATPFAFLWLVSKGEWIGFGDAKLALGIGWFMGLIDGISSVALAFWIGSIFGVSLILLSKLQTLSFVRDNFTIKSEVPFAPFLIIGMLLVFFFNWDVLGLKLFLL
ncbi:prepilin peptidase [Patescibacteria group bacterium]|nr:prepilin peptidase [Patescibacteria group bacterium]